MKGAPESVRAVSGRHLPALDGLRAVAILGVMAYHLGFGWASGGYLGVDLFFVLSGFLITSLLVEERHSSGTIRLGAFWGRRARRLLPALFLVLVAVSLYAIINGRFSSPGAGGAAIDLSGLRGDALATLFYVANWHSIFTHQSYFAQFSTPSPLQHTWSLAIEEQFYLVWPLLVVGLFRWTAARWRKVGATLCVIGALGSAAAMAVLYNPAGDPSRIYYGTDTRAFDLLAGAFVAFLVAGRPQPGATARTWLHRMGPAAACALIPCWIWAGTKSELPTGTMFLGGFLGCAVLAAVVIADVRQFDQGPLARALSGRPLRWIGRVSYGLYLWHWPIFVYLNQARTGLSGAGLEIAQVAVTFVVATASYYLVELPVRRQRFAGGARRMALPGAVIATVVVILVGTSASIAAPALNVPVHEQAGGLNPGTGRAVVGAGGYQGEVPIDLAQGTVIDAAHPLRVVAFGDSIMTLAQYGIQAALQTTKEVVFGRAADPGWGLTMPDGSAVLRHIVRAFHPQILVGTWSWDAPAALTDPAGYQATLDAAIRRTLTPGDGVLGIIFLQLPALGVDPLTATETPAEQQVLAERIAGVPAWNHAVQEAAATFPGKVMYLPVASSLEIDGAFTKWLPPHDKWSAAPARWVRVRTLDGVHLCPAGITRYAAPVFQDLTAIFHLPTVPYAWWHSPLITANLYENSTSLASSCPDDHPPKTPPRS
jgi:peptidoglycan/LPS O-acetylase OafA/YrhL